MTATSIRCADCGRFVDHAEIAGGFARCEVEPLSEFGPERIEWTCAGCVCRAEHRREALREMTRIDEELGLYDDGTVVPPSPGVHP